MKIAVTYDNGNVFQHFGRTEQFKVYDVEDGKIVSSEIMGTNGIGHEALAGLLAQYSIDALICGGMGQGAQDALAEAGIDVCAGAEGDTDATSEENSSIQALTVITITKESMNIIMKRVAAAAAALSQAAAAAAPDAVSLCTTSSQRIPERQ